MVATLFLHSNWLVPLCQKVAPGRKRKRQGRLPIPFLVRPNCWWKKSCTPGMIPHTYFPTCLKMYKSSKNPLLFTALQAISQALHPKSIITLPGLDLPRRVQEGWVGGTCESSSCTCGIAGLVLIRDFVPSWLLAISISTKRLQIRNVVLRKKDDFNTIQQ